jgi:threonine dehydrogenase-like Zn-dependent dehydrogenase
MPPGPDLGRDVFMGHEFSATVLEAGPGTEAPGAGTLVTSVPYIVSPRGIHDLAYGNELPGGYSERMLLAAPLLLPVPNGLDARRAALTEPMAVGLHAVNRSRIEAGQGAVVIGCGPVGLAVIAALALRGIEPVVACDYSPTRRSLASAMGAHRVVDPAAEAVFDAWAETGGAAGLVVFEAVGVPGVINTILRDIPPQAQVVVVGVCMQTDSFVPFFGIAKEINVQFVLGYSPEEFAASLSDLAEGRIDAGPMLTGEVGLDGLPAAFEDLADPDRHCKILCRPGM